MSLSPRPLLVILSALLLVGVGAGPQAPAPIAAPAGELEQAELRLRKLHLVRPDLIPYPVAYEVYC